MRIGNLNLKGKVLAAPMAGISNRPFRLLALEAGAALTFTEMVSSEGIIRRQAKTLAYLDFQEDERPIGIQIFGAKPEVMKKAAEIIVERNQPDVIDINFGCPVKKVVNHNGGAAVLKDLVLTDEIIRATVEGAGQTPVTIKIRTGWDEQKPVYEEVGHIAEKAGVAAITLHARSRSKGFSGQADWSAIAKLKQAVSLPVIGNGDIFSPQDARRMIEQTACDGVMIGRAAMGNPYIFTQVHRFLEEGILLENPTTLDKIRLAYRHACLMKEEYGEERGIKKMRRYLGWYIKGMRQAALLRPRLFQVNTLKDIEDIFSEYLGESTAAFRKTVSAE